MSNIEQGISNRRSKRKYIEIRYSRYNILQFVLGKIFKLIRELEDINIPELRGIFGRIQGTSTGA